MLISSLNCVLCGRRPEFHGENMFKGKINVKNGILIAKLVKNDILFVQIASHFKNVVFLILLPKLRES